MQRPGKEASVLGLKDPNEISLCLPDGTFFTRNVPSPGVLQPCRALSPLHLSAHLLIRVFTGNVTHSPMFLSEGRLKSS